jgi:hypothetical protein
MQIGRCPLTCEHRPQLCPAMAALPATILASAGVCTVYKVSENASSTCQPWMKTPVVSSSTPTVRLQPQVDISAVPCSGKWKHCLDQIRCCIYLVYCEQPRSTAIISTLHTQTGDTTLLNLFACCDRNMLSLYQTARVAENGLIVDWTGAPHTVLAGEDL